MNIEVLREHAHHWYGRIAQFFLFQTLMMYVIACLAAHSPVGPGAYVSFLHHCFQWNGR